MAAPTIKAFWRQLAASKLFGPDRLVKLASEFEKARAGDGDATSIDLAKWLIAQRALTREQAENLLRRAANPNGPIDKQGPPKRGEVAEDDATMSTAATPPPPPPPTSDPTREGGDLAAARTVAEPTAVATAPQFEPTPAAGPPPLTHPGAVPPRQGSRRLLLIGSLAGIVLLLAGAILLVLLRRPAPPLATATPDLNTEVASPDEEPPEDPEGAETPADEGPPSEDRDDSPASVQEDDPDRNDMTAAPQFDLVEDDGKSLWTSPTSGSPPPLWHVPAGTQVVMTFQTAALLAREEGAALLTALGPGVDEYRRWIEVATGWSLADIRRLDVMLGEGTDLSDDTALLAVVVYPQIPLAQGELAASWQEDRHAALEGAGFASTSLAFHIAAPDRIVIARANVIAEMQAGEDHSPQDTGEPPEAGAAVPAESLGEGEPPSERVEASLAADSPQPPPAPLPPPLPELWESVDGDRHCNILFAASYLRSARESLFGQYLSPLREGVDWMFGSGDEVQAGLLSLHFDEQLFAELRIYGVRDVLPRLLARDFHDRIDASPRRLREHLKTLSLHPYSRDVLWDFPEMLRSVSRYTRHDRDGRQGIVRCYLPATAASHLALGIELTMWETAREGGAGAPPARREPRTLADRLEQRATLSFGKSSLEMALETLAEDVGFRVVILGGDLQLDGITKNQSFGLDMRDRPVREILDAIVQQANPDKTATQLSDDAQKLIYVVKPKYEGGEDAVVITTRARAAERGDVLPPQFVAR